MSKAKENGGLHATNSETTLKMKNLKGIHEDDGNTNEADHANIEPLDVQVLQYVLESMGADKYEPRVVTQLQEFVHRYVTEILIDAQEYSMYADKREIDADDIRLAIASRLNHHFAHVPSRELMMELAEKRNSIPLPPISNEYGVRLPPMQHQLITHEGDRQQDHYATTRPEDDDDDGFDDVLPTRSSLLASTLPPQEGTRNKKIARSPIAIRLHSR